MGITFINMARQKDQMSGVLRKRLFCKIYQPNKRNFRKADKAKNKN